MAHPHNPVEVRSYRADAFRRKSMPLSGATAEVHGPGNATVLRWGEAFVLLDVRIQMIKLWSKDVRDLGSRVRLDWCIACLEDVRQALTDLHIRVVAGRLRQQNPREAPVVAYLSEAYVWCGDALADVHSFVEKLRHVSEVGQPDLVDDCSAYIDDFLGPLLRRVGDSSRAAPSSTSLRQLLPLAKQLHVAIVSLNRALR
jgi:hypothetical protein